MFRASPGGGSLRDDISAATGHEPKKRKLTSEPNPLVFEKKPSCQPIALIDATTCEVVSRFTLSHIE